MLGNVSTGGYGRVAIHSRLLRVPVRAMPATMADWTLGIYMMLDEMRLLLVFLEGSEWVEYLMFDGRS